ncbi:uncharacterized protein BDV17DRAFT_146820 [Aspergillus undulatus]|uniref:uncharacterized protein n=1 Tax=Aspergillus undulatus TaxID=1810928 RepID=UPI003CCD41F3
MLGIPIKVRMPKLDFELVIWRLIGAGRSRLPVFARSKRKAHRERLSIEQIISDIGDGLQGRELLEDSRDDYSSSETGNPFSYPPTLDPAFIQSQQSKIPSDSGHVSRWNKDRVQVPHALDDFETTLHSVEMFCQVIESGKSVARCSALKFAANPALDVEQTVVKKLDPYVRKMYIAWKETVYNPRHGIEQDSEHKKFVLPKLNWRKCVEPVSDEARVRSKFFSLAEAVDVVFGHRGATLENAMWLQIKKSRIMLLVLIVRKILMLEKSRRLNQAPKMPGLSLTQAADLQTIRRVVAQADENLNREMTRFLKNASTEGLPGDVHSKRELGEFLKKVNRLNESLDFLRGHAQYLESRCLKTYRFTKEAQPKGTDLDEIKPEKTMSRTESI